MSYQPVSNTSYVRLDQITTNKNLQDKSKILEDGRCPLSVRTAFEANRNAAMNNGRPVRIRFCWGVCCAPPVLLEKILRTFCFTLCFPCASVVSYGSGKKYMIDGQVKHVWKRVSEEWYDTAMTMTACYMNVCGCCSPSSIDTIVENVANDYFNRIAKDREYDENFKNHVIAYGIYKEKRKLAWKTGDVPPDKAEVMNDYLNKKPIKQSEGHALINNIDEEN